MDRIEQAAPKRHGDPPDADASSRPVIKGEVTVDPLSSPRNRSPFKGKAIKIKKG